MGSNGVVKFPWVSLHSLEAAKAEVEGLMVKITGPHILCTFLQTQGINKDTIPKTGVKYFISKHIFVHCCKANFAGTHCTFLTLWDGTTLVFLASYSTGSVPIPYGSVENESQLIVE